MKAVYQAAAEKLATAATEFAKTLPPIDALRAWMMLFVDYIADKQIIAPALNALVDDPHKLYEASYGHATLFLEEQWQLMGALEALNGMLLFGLTTAFLFAMIQKVWPLGSRGRHREAEGKIPHRGIHVSENYPSDIRLILESQNMKIFFCSKFLPTLRQGRGKGECQRQWK